MFEELIKKEFLDWVFVDCYKLKIVKIVALLWHHQLAVPTPLLIVLERVDSDWCYLFFNCKFLLQSVTSNLHMLFGGIFESTCDKVKSRRSSWISKQFLQQNPIKNYCKVWQVSQSETKCIIKCNRYDKVWQKVITKYD